MNRAITFLVRRRLWRFRFVHLLIAALVATVMVAMLLFQGYLVALSGEFSGQLTYPKLPAVFLARASSDDSPAVNRSLPQLQLSIWSVVTPGGRVEMAGVTSTRLPDWPQPLVGDVWLPISQRDQIYTQQVGDQLTLTLLNGRDLASAKARVAGYYDDGGYLSPVLVSMEWVASWVEQPADSIVLAYQEGARQELQRWANGNERAELLTEQDIVQGASNLVQSLYSGGYTAVLMGAIFLALGFGVLALLIFLDSHTELAILKALGTRPCEASWFFWVEFGCSTLVGVTLGWVAINWLKSRLGSMIALNWSIVRSALLVVAGAYVLAMLAPARLAQRAQVNDLLYRRPILLMSQSINALTRHEPALNDLLSRGWSCIRLERDGGDFPGIVVRPVGSSVKEGETLAWQSTWFGLGEKRYVAPHDGVLMFADEQRGVLAISADERA